MKTSAKAIHRTLLENKPKTFKDLQNVLSVFRFRNGLAWANAYYMGVYQGIRLFYFDSKNEKIDLPSKRSVYLIQENKELPKIFVDSTGKEIKGR